LIKLNQPVLTGFCRSVLSSWTGRFLPVFTGLERFLDRPVTGRTGPVQSLHRPDRTGLVFFRPVTTLRHGGAMPSPWPCKLLVR
jgi:hypothetical protein